MKKANGRKIKIVILSFIFIFSLFGLAIFFTEQLKFTTQAQEVRREVEELAEQREPETLSRELPPRETLEDFENREFEREIEILRERISNLEYIIEEKDNNIDFYKSQLSAQNSKDDLQSILLAISTFILNILSIAGIIKSFRKQKA